MVRRGTLVRAGNAGVVSCRGARAVSLVPGLPHGAPAAVSEVPGLPHGRTLVAMAEPESESRPSGCDSPGLAGGRLMASTCGGWGPGAGCPVGSVAGPVAGVAVVCVVGAGLGAAPFTIVTGVPDSSCFPDGDDATFPEWTASPLNVRPEGGPLMVTPAATESGGSAPVSAESARRDPPQATAATVRTSEAAKGECGRIDISFTARPGSPRAQPRPPAAADRRCRPSPRSAGSRTAWRS